MSAVPKLDKSVSPEAPFPRLNELGKLLSENDLEVSSEAWDQSLLFLAQELLPAMRSLHLSLGLIRHLVSSETMGEVAERNLHQLLNIACHQMQRVEKGVEKFTENAGPLPPLSGLLK